MREQLYCYKAKVRSVYDGDTMRVDIDLGLGVSIKNEPVRLSRINAPEVRGAQRPEGLDSKHFLLQRLQDREVFLRTIKDDKGKYGRYIVEVFLEENGAFININDELVSKGLAVYRQY